MKTFVCQICGHIAFDEAPVECPVCGMPIENFENEPDAIRTPSEPDALNETEKKHVPVIEVTRECGLTPDVGCIDVHVKVGEIMHVMESEHLIDFIDLYINKRYVTRVSLTRKVLYPAARVHLNVHEGIVTVVARCNVHGHWMNRVNLKDI
jgi:superoxide reductase